MITVLQIVAVLVLVVLGVWLAIRMKGQKPLAPLPEHYKEILNDYVKFYRQLDGPGKDVFEKRVEQFLNSIRITGVNAEVEDLDRLLIGSAAIIPVFNFPDWQYINLHEVLLYPGAFNTDFDQHGSERSVAGMVGNGPMNHTMILTKWQVRQHFLHEEGTRNTAIHEFVHLIDGMDGTMDGVPEIILERRYVPAWKQLMAETIHSIKTHGSDIDEYAATSPVEFFAVVSEYYFMQPDLLGDRHPRLIDKLRHIYGMNK